jgi:hypothetical protein
VDVGMKAAKEKNRQNQMQRRGSTMRQCCGTRAGGIGYRFGGGGDVYMGGRYRRW